MSSSITESSFKNTAKEVKKAISEAAKNGTSLKLSHVQELLAHSLYNKPYGEVLKTTLIRDRSKGKVTQKNTTQPVTALLTCGSMQIIAHDGDYVSCSQEGTDIYIDPRLYKDQAEAIANTHNSKFVEFDVPMSLNAWQVEDVIQMAIDFGVFDSRTSLLNRLEQELNVILIDGRHCPYGLNGDWENEMTGDDDGVDGCIWFAETHTPDGGLYEYNLTARELANSYEVSPNVWLINRKYEDGEEQTIEIKVF